MRKLLSILVLCAASVALHAQTCVPSATNTCTPNVKLSMPDFQSQGWDVPENNNELLLDSYLSGALPIPALQVTGTLSASSLDNVQFADRFTGSDACSKIIAAGAALPSTGGVIDARGFQGAQTCASGDLTSIGKPVTILLGAATFSINSPLKIPSKSFVRGIGRGDSGSDGTAIKAGASFPTSGTANGGAPLVDFSAGPVFYGRVENLTLDCNGTANCGGFYATDIQEQSGLEHVLIANAPNFGVWIDTTGGHVAQNWHLFDIEVLPQTATASSSIGIKVKGSAFQYITGATVTGGAAQSGSAGISIQSVTYGSIIGTHVERNATGYLLDNSSVALVNAQCSGVSGAPMTDCVRIVNTSGSVNNLSLSQIAAAGSVTNTLNDTVNSRTLATASSTSLASYLIGDNSTQGVLTNETNLASYINNNWTFANALVLQSTVSKYNNIATVGSGIPAQYATVDLTAQGASIGATTLYTTPAAGMYRVSCYIVVTQAATTSSTLPACNITWGDQQTNVGLTQALTATSTGNTTSTFAQATAFISVHSGSNVQYSTTGYATSGATSMQYAVHIRLEAL